MIVFFPRTPDISVAGVANTIEYNYTFSFTQYKTAIVNFITGIWENNSLGGTKYARVTVEQELFKYYPKSLKIIATAFIISLIFGILKGIFDYHNTNNKKNIIGNGTTWLFQSLPDFFLVMVIQWALINTFHSLKIFGQSNWYSFLFLAILVAIHPMLYISRITYVSIASQEGQPYVQVARVKGFTKRKVLYKHILLNCIQTIFLHITSLMLYLLTNLLIV